MRSSFTVAGLAGIAVGVALLASCGSGGVSFGSGASSGAGGRGVGPESGSSVTSPSSSGPGSGSGHGSSTGGSISGSTGPTTVASSSGAGTSNGGSSASNGSSAGPSSSSGVATCSGGAACVSVAPSGWTGPVVFDQATGKPPPCPAGTSPAAQGGTKITPPTACAACSCGVLENVSCPIIYAGPHASALQACGDAQCSNSTAVTSTCTPVSSSSCAVQALQFYTNGTPAGGTCSGNGTTPAPASQPVFGDGASVCSFTGGLPSCGPSSVCAPPPPSGSRLCVYQSGANAGACPAPYDATAQPTVFYEDIESSYACSPCTCTGQAKACAGDAVFSLNSNCSNGTTIAVPGSCGTSPAPGEQLYVMLTSLHGVGACQAASGSQLSGSATGKNPVSVCCM